MAGRFIAAQDIGFAGNARPKFRLKRAKVRLATARLRWLEIGDSTTAGTLVPGRATSTPGRLAALLNTAGLSASDHSSFGDAGKGTAANFVAYDPRWGLGSGWDVYASADFRTLGGGMWSNQTTTNAASFTPTGNVDTFILHYARVGSPGSMTVDIDGAPSGPGFASVNTQGANAMLTVTVTHATPGAHTLNIKRVSGVIILVGVIAYNSTVPAVDVINCGWSGSLSTNWNVATWPWSPINAITTIAPDMTRINLGINDWDAAQRTDITTFQTNIATITTTAKASGDVMLTKPFPSDVSVASVAVQQQFCAAIGAVATAQSCEILDLQARFIDYVAAAAAGFTSNDNYHPSLEGYSDIAEPLAAWALA